MSGVCTRNRAIAIVGVSAVLCLILISCVGEVTEQYGGSLRLVNVVFRHGQRTPADTFPTDPHVKFDFPPYGWGQLTNEGKQQQYNLGQSLRQRYNQFLGDRYSTSAVRVQSTDVDRTIMSAQLAMAGLFPPVGDQRWNDKLNWQPVPIHSQPLDQDSLLLVRVPCPRYHEARDAVMATPEVKQYLNDLTKLFRALTKYSGMTISDPDDVQSLYSTMLAERQFNLTLPNWTKAYYPNPMAAVTAYSFTLNAYNNELKKLKGGPLLKKILEDAEDKVNNEASQQKMFVYAGHDSTVANLLSALGVWEEQIPVYNIMAILELHKLGSDYAFKIFLQNTTEHEPYALRVPGCEEFCPLHQLTELTRSVVPTDLSADCVSHDHGYVAPSPSGP